MEDDAQSLLARLRVEQRKLEAVRELSRAFGATHELDALLKLLLRKVTELLEAERATIFLLSDDGSELISKFFQGDAVQEIRLKVGEGIAGWVAHSGQTVNLADAYTDPRFHKGTDQQTGFRTRSVLCMPMPDRTGRTSGVVQVLNRRSGAFDADDEALLGAVAAHAAIAFENSKLFHSVLTQNRLASIGQMLSGVLHDLKTPMTIISGYAQLLAETDDAPTRRDYTALILKQFDHMAAMTREVLAFAKGESTLLVRKVHLNTFVAEMTEHLQRELSGKAIELRVDARYTGSAHFDELKLHRLVHNIARNAAQAMPRGGTFVVSIFADGDRLCFDFADSGTGIPAELEGKLFTLFATAGKPDGTGLGLAIVKKIVDEHNGTIHYTSSAGQGTTFHVALPLARP